MIKRLSILITSFMPGLAMADDAAIDFVGAALDLVVQPATASIPEPSLPMLLAVGGGVAIAVKYLRRNK